MGKSSSAPTPSYSNGVINVNGENKVNTYKKGNDIVSDYYMSDAEKRMYDYARNSFANSAQNVNVFDENTKKSIQNQLNAYSAKGQNLINNYYTPLLNDLKADVAKRFGNLDNSVFMDNLNSIESKRAESINSLAQDVLAKENELVNSELNRRYSYLNFLNDVQNQINSNMYNLINISRNNSSSGNDYNMRSYNSQQNSNIDYTNPLVYAELMNSFISTTGLF